MLAPRPLSAPIPRRVYDLPAAVQRVIVWCFLGCVLERLPSGYRATPGAVMPWFWQPAVRSVRTETAERAVATGLLSPVSAGLFGDALAWVWPVSAAGVADSCRRAA